MEDCQIKYSKNEFKLLSKAAKYRFWLYCSLTSPEFYKKNKKHLIRLCDTLQALKEKRLIHPITGKICSKLIVSMPPQHGKSRTLVKFAQWCLGNNKQERIITASYSDETAGDFSKYVRDGILEEKNIIDDTMIFSDIFPDIKIKKGSSSSYKWALEGEHFNYLGAGMGGGITGKGATIRICDDLVKGAAEALSDNYLNACWTWFSSTFSSRNAPAEGESVLEIIVMTRWSDKDVIGVLLNTEADKWYHLDMPICDLKSLESDEENIEMRCPAILSREDFLDLKKRASLNIVTSQIFYANYFGITVNEQGKLYKNLKTYTTLPPYVQICSYTDTADEGDNYLCSIVFAIVLSGHDREAYILDVLYSQEGMEVTEPETARMFQKNKVSFADIESNSGGRGFARNVNDYLKKGLGYHSCVVNWFHQSQNKLGRILTGSAGVQQSIYFPVNWADKWSAFNLAITTFQKEGKNKFDDAPDALTGVWEYITNKFSNTMKDAKKATTPPLKPTGRQW